MPEKTSYSNVSPIRPGIHVAGAGLGSGLKGGGGDGTSGDMESRVKSLEDKFLRIETRLDGIATDLAYVKGKIDGLPTAAAFGELKGRVDSLPTTAKVAAVVGMVGTGLLVISRWAEITAFFKG